MQIFLVMTRYPSGLFVQRAFSCDRAARAWAAQQREAGMTECLELPVIGELEQPHLAYTIRWHETTPETRNVELIFGGREQASAAASDQGSVQELRIETGMDASGRTAGREREVIDFDAALSRLRRIRNMAQRAFLHQPA